MAMNCGLYDNWKKDQMCIRDRYKIHQIEAYFVVRAKKNLGYKSIQWKRRLPKNVLSDASVLLTDVYKRQLLPFLKDKTGID